MCAVYSPFEMPILFPLGVQVSLEADVKRIGSVTCLHERCRNRIDAILPALPPQHFSVGRNDNPPSRHGDPKAWTNILDVVWTYKIRLAKIGPLGKRALNVPNAPFVGFRLPLAMPASSPSRKSISCPLRDLIV